MPHEVLTLETNTFQGFYNFNWEFLVLGLEWFNWLFTLTKLSKLIKNISLQGKSQY